VPSRIGRERLARLSTPAIETFRDDLLRKGSRAMARKVLTSLKGIIGEAQRRGLAAHNAAQPVSVDVKKREKAKLVVGRGQGFSAKRVLLGHSSIQMTFDVYGHLFPHSKTTTPNSPPASSRWLGSRCTSSSP
jgi:hypothetical protein